MKNTFSWLLVLCIVIVIIAIVTYYKVDSLEERLARNTTPNTTYHSTIINVEKVEGGNNVFGENNKVELNQEPANV